MIFGAATPADANYSVTPALAVLLARLQRLNVNRRVRVGRRLIDCRGQLVTSELQFSGLGSEPA